MTTLWTRDRRNQTCSAARPTARRPRRSTRTSSTPRSTAIKIAKAGSKKKFDETVDVAMRLGVDPRKADQMVRGTVNLPHGTGKTARVLVFANADKADAAREAGADIVGGDELIEKVNGGWLDFDAVVATPDMMGKVGRLGRVLGPRGLMPNPKTGTVTPDVAKAVSDIKGGKIEFRVDRHANLHFIIGKASFSEAQLAENYAAALEEVLRLKPASSKGRYLARSPSPRPWAPASRSTRTAPATSSTDATRPEPRSTPPTHRRARVTPAGAPGPSQCVRCRPATRRRRARRRAARRPAGRRCRSGTGRSASGTRGPTPPRPLRFFSTREHRPVLELLDVAHAVDEVVAGHDVVLVVEQQDGVGLVGQRRRAAHVADPHPLARRRGPPCRRRPRRGPGRRGRGRGP